MSGIPVVVVERFGLPVRAVEGRAPVMTVSPYGLGIPIVLSEWGAPFVLEGYEPPPPPDFSGLGLDMAFEFTAQSTSVTTSNGRVVTASGREGLPGASTATQGPLQRTDGAGTRCWRFEDGDTLDINGDFAFLPREFTVLVVARQHRRQSNSFYFGGKFQSDGETPANTGFPALRTLGVGGAQWLASSSQFSYNAPDNAEYGGVGSQLACFGAACRSDGNGGTRMIMNGVGMDLAQVATSAQVVGGRIGGYMFSGQNNSGFDLYSIVAFHGVLTNQELSDASDVLMDYFDIVPFTRNLILEGGSTTFGTGEVSSGDSLGMVLTEPGADRIPADVRVMNTAQLAGDVSGCVNRRDSGTGWPRLQLGGDPADNRVALQIGRRDIDTGGMTAEDVYDAILDYWNDSGDGVVDRGWAPFQMANIATSSEEVSEDLHGLIVSNFENDVANGQVIDLQAIERDGFLPFVMENRNDQYYQVPTLAVPTVAGVRVMGSGADTPEHGYAAVFADEA